MQFISQEDLKIVIPLIKVNAALRDLTAIFVQEMQLLWHPVCFPVRILSLKDRQIFTKGQEQFWNIYL